MDRNVYLAFQNFLENNRNQLSYKIYALLSNYCTFKIGGTATFVVFPHTTEACIATIRQLQQTAIRYFVLGNASNVLFADEGVDGVILFTSQIRELSTAKAGITASTGISLTAAAVYAQKQGLSGMEFAYGIPGSCGGAIYMNAGAYTGEMKDIVLQSTYYDSQKDEVCRLSQEKHAFSYRHSFYTDTNHVILSANFQLKEDDPLAIRERMDFFMKCRVEKQPLDYPSAGSVFKRYPGYYTSKLIEEAGLKGCTIGGAQVSTKHAGFIINLGNATAMDVIHLVEKVKGVISDKNGIHIECEIKYIK